MRWGSRKAIRGGGMKRNMRVSCIIPAYNEEKSIAHTLEAAIGAGDSLAEIVVVDDGSGDRTRDIVRGFPGVRLVVQERRSGKSGAVARGIAEAAGDTLLFLDADLLGLTAGDLLALIEPVRSGEADVVISLRANSPAWMKRIHLDFMSGERIFPKGMVEPHLGQIAALRGFALEVFLNRLIISKGIRIKTVMMKTVRNDMKWHKHGIVKGLWDEFKLWMEIFRTVTPVEFIYQNVKMRQLLVRHGPNTPENS